MWDDLFARYEPDLAFGADVERYIIQELCGDEVTVSRVIAPGDRIDLGGATLNVIEAAGHSAGHISLFDDHSGVLFTGDAVQGSGIGHVASDVSLPPLYEDATAYVATQRRLKNLGARQLCSAHHATQVGDRVEAFLDESAAFVDRCGVLVHEILGAADGLTRSEIATELKCRLDQLYVHNFSGPLQLMLMADTHLSQLASESVAISHDDIWTTA